MKKVRQARSKKAASEEDLFEEDDGLPDAELREFIASAAHYQAQERGFESWQERDDWLADEFETGDMRGTEWTA